MTVSLTTGTSSSGLTDRYGVQMIASGSLDLLSRLAVNGTALIVQRWYDGSALDCGCWDMHDCERSVGSARDRDARRAEG